MYGTTAYTLSVYNENQSLNDSTTTALLTHYSDGTKTMTGGLSFTATKDGDSNGNLDTYYIRVYAPASATCSYRLMIEYSTDYASLNWQYPLPTNWVDVSSPAGTRLFNGSYEYHEGIDIPANSGVDVLAVADAYVYRSSWDSSMGNYVTLYTAVVENLAIKSRLDVDPYDSEASFVITYMHLSLLSVAEGTDVTKEQKIGEVGTTGYSTGNHLHIGIFSSSTLPNYMTANLPTDVINPYDFFYDDVSFTGTPY